MGGSTQANALLHFEHDARDVLGFVALDSNSDVIGVMPTAAPPGAGPYTLCKGVSKAIGVAGAVAAQPHKSAGEYQFTLDEAWFALVGADVTFQDSSAASVTAKVDANVRANTTSADAGVQPGTDATLTAQTVRVRFRNSTGALTDPPASKGFWLRLTLKRTGVP